MAPARGRCARSSLSLTTTVGSSLCPCTNIYVTLHHALPKYNSLQAGASNALQEWDSRKFFLGNIQTLYFSFWQCSHNGAQWAVLCVKSPIQIANYEKSVSWNFETEYRIYVVTVSQANCLFQHKQKVSDYNTSYFGKREERSVSWDLPLSITWIESSAHWMHIIYLSKKNQKTQ